MSLKYLFSLFLLLTSLSASASTYFLDPVKGSLSGDGSVDSPYPSLEEVIESQLIATKSYPTPYSGDTQQELLSKNTNAPIQAGDTLILLPGFHGDIDLVNAVNADWIYIKSQVKGEASLGSISILGGQKWSFDGVLVDRTLSLEERVRRNYLVNFESHAHQGPVKDIEFKNSTVRTIDDISDWTRDDWVSRIVNGIHSSADSILITGNTVTNIGFGIATTGDNSRVQKNKIVNFSGDGIRGLGDNSRYEYNFIANGFDIDKNHDDGFQSWQTKESGVNNVYIRHNYFVENYKHPNVELLSRFQGIGLFDGLYNDFVIENNLVYISTYHGITLLGGSNNEIKGNTVMDSDPNDNIIPWIRLTDTKAGYYGTNNVISDNTSRTVEDNNGAYWLNNMEIQDEDYDAINRILVSSISFYSSLLD